jgi:hypothetical protein
MVLLYNSFGKQFTCERKNWKTCPEHRNFSLTPPARFDVKNLNLPEDKPMFSMDGPVFTSEEFIQMSKEGTFTVPVRLSQEEVDECDWDTLSYTFGKMIGGELFNRKDIVIFNRDKTENGVVHFTVTYMRSNA